ncbi:MAG: SDR family oxidoreductase [Balneolaceae bacterium]|nr:SDR family oxidoreductase [Balneolaceae bacterium]
MGANRINGKSVCITGATSGIGKATARLFAEEGASLILTGRRKTRLDTLSDELKQNHGVAVSVYDFDVRNQEACISFVNGLDGSIDILVNNAGLAKGADSVYAADVSDWETMIDTNVKGLLYLTRLVAPGMKERNAGHIINIGSIAGHESYPGGSVYCATKHAVKAITESTKKDLHGTRVRVSMVSPGLVETEFSNVRFNDDNEKADQVYKGMQPLVAQDIAEIILFTANRPAHVNIMDTFVLPVYQSSSQMVHRDE